MKHEVRHALTAGLVLVLTVGAAAAPPRFVGVLALGERCWFALTEAGQPTRWVAIGDNFDGYRVSAYRPEHDTLLLCRGKALACLPLESGVRGQPLMSRDQVRVIAEQYFSAMRESGLQVAAPRRFKENWLVIGRRNVGNRTETHTLLVSTRGEVLQSLRNPADQHPAGDK